MTGHRLQVQQTSVEGEILLSSGVLALDLVRHLFSEKLSKSTVVIFWMLQPLCGELDDRLTLLGYNPVAICQISQGNTTVLQHTGLHDDFLLLSGVLLHQLWVVSLGPQHHRVISVAEQFADRIGVQLQPVTNSAERIGYLVVHSSEVLYGEVESRQRCHPAMSYGIQVRGGHHISKRLVFTRNGWYCRYSQNCSVIAHLRARNSNLDEWYLNSPPFKPQLA